MNGQLVVGRKGLAGMKSSAPFQHPPVVLLDGTTTLPRAMLGNKGYGINAMRREGLPVPPAFCITTEV